MGRRTRGLGVAGDARGVWRCPRAARDAENRRAHDLDERFWAERAARTASVSGVFRRVRRRSGVAVRTADAPGGVGRDVRDGRRVADGSRRSSLGRGAGKSEQRRRAGLLRLRVADAAGPGKLSLDALLFGRQRTATPGEARVESGVPLGTR